MNAAEARRRMRDALAADRLVWSFHQGQRRGQRAVAVADIEDALRSAGLPNPGEAWKFTGKTETGERLCVVVGFDSEDPTIVTVWWVS